MSVKQTRLIDFGKRSGLKTYPVSIGAMRLPADIDQAVALLRQAIDAGMVYIDTCRGYVDSETKLAKALKDGYREKVILSTKWCPWNLKIEPDDNTTAECTYKRLRESMQRLEVDYLDFYQIWSLNKREQYEQATCKGGMLDGVKKAKDEGLIKHIGFTTHDEPSNVSDYIDQADWCEAILFSHNMFNLTYKEVIAKAHEKGIATLVMNPAGGGMFTENSPVIKRAVKEAVGLDDPIEASHRYLAGDDNIDTILCGISKPSDITSTIENYEKLPFTADQRGALESAFAKISKEGMNFCTSCGYCKPCPNGINIPVMMEVVYLERLLKVSKKAKVSYNWQVSDNNADRSALPSDCIECGQCEQKCTQKLNIIEQMKYLAENKFFKK